MPSSGTARDSVCRSGSGIVWALPELPLIDLLLLTLAAAAAGLVNALAGGGTLITFPALLAAGLPPVQANITSTLALAPGYLGATFGQRADLDGQGRRLLALLPLAALGGVGGAALLLHASESTFEALVPWLIIGASLLIAVQEPVRRWVLAHHGPGTAGAAAGSGVGALTAAALAVALAAVYGGYFGAGLSVIVLAALGLTLADDFRRLNAAKQAIAFMANMAAAVSLAFSGRAAWPAVIAMAMGALVGGAAGGRLAGRIDPQRLRVLVVTLGLAIGLVYLWR